MKLYTGTGDRGKTNLFSGERVTKSHIRVETYGDVDELNSVLGALLAVLPKEYSQLSKEIQCIQSNLFHIGAWLATIPDSPSISVLEEITANHSAPLETAMDRMQTELSDLHGFILPGGHITAAWAHVARTVCRRAERHFVALYKQPGNNKADNQCQHVLLYLNRLSDYLFVLARYCNNLFGEPDTLWKP